MDINKILTADALDLIFEGRFKEYGAYQLRKTYNDRLKKALIGMFAFTVLLAAGAIWSNSAKKSKTEIIVTDVSLTDVTQEKSHRHRHLHRQSKNHQKWKWRNLHLLKS